MRMVDYERDLDNYLDEYNEEKVRYLNKRVRVVEKNGKKKYDELLNMEGVVTREGSNIGVLIDGRKNELSSYGVFWFKREELEILEDMEEDNMKGYNYVVMAKFLDGCNNKEYAFALYDEDEKLIRGKGDLVVVNAKHKDNRTLCVVESIMSVEAYNERDDKATITSQVVGVVNMDRYVAHVEEEKRLKELAKKKLEIEKELEREINKRKSVEYYEAMAEKYSDNPKLAELVAELKGLGL